MELGFGTSPLSSKKLKTIFKTVCYDINNQLFSLQEIEHSILRAKMSRPLNNMIGNNMIGNGIFERLGSVRFGKGDGRNKWCLTKPDLRINFVVIITNVILFHIMLSLILGQNLVFIIYGSFRTMQTFLMNN